jgi:hypothetical protein
MLAEITYFLCAATSLCAAMLLLDTYRRRRAPLLLWSALAFVGLALNNMLMFVDLVVAPGALDLSVARAVLAAVAMLVLNLGLIAESV